MKINYFKNVHRFNRICLGGFLIAALSLMSCAEEEVEVKSAKKFCLSEIMKAKIQLDTVRSLTITETVHLTGNVEYNSDRVIDFVSFVGGVIKNTYFTLGDPVKKGQLLAEIESAELSGLLAQKRSQIAQILVAKRELDSHSGLYRDHVVSQKDLVAAQSNVEILEAELENIEAQLNLYSASSERGVFQIKAPSSGIIVRKNISTGMQISANSEPLFTVSDLDEVWIMADVYAGNVPFIKENMNVAINAIAYPDELFMGKINTLSQVFDAENRVLKARIVMSNAANKLMPGMFVDVLVEKETGKVATAVPSSALIFDNNQYFLLIYKDDCEIEVRVVNPLVENADTVFFESNIEIGERIITKNNLLIYNQIK